MPSIEAHPDDVFEHDVPGYDLRRLILARDPLASSLAFSVQIRLVLATILGFRMCEDCPHCSDLDNPCMDTFGSCAEAMGGIAGRCDGIAGAVECQKSKGTLHLHFWTYVQRVHQYRSLEEIGRMLVEALITADDLKRFTENLCNENYPLSDALEAEVDELERRWPCFKETDCEDQNPTMEWGDFRYGRIPPFVWNDTGADYSSIKPSMSPSSAKVLQEALHSDTLAYQTQFARALQETLKCVQQFRPDTETSASHETSASSN